MGPSINQADNRLLIKGYLPVRVRFPSTPTDDHEHVTFMYVKEHQHRQQQSLEEPPQPTLFIANAPSYPPIDTPTMLKALLGRFGNIKRVTVVPNPRSSQTTTASTSTLSSSSSSSSLMADWYFGHTITDRYAHVVFETPKDLKKCYKALQRVMETSSTDDAALTVDAVERQTLADAMQDHGRQNVNEQDESNDEADGDGVAKDLSGIQKVLSTCRKNQLRHQQRHVLLQECNAVMEAYEEAEQARLRAISSEPDEDGFVTVTHATQPAIGDDLEQQGGRPKRHAAKGRSRKRKKGPGTQSLDDFYRFQTKARRKEDIQDLRQRFQEDLQRIQKLKETQGGFKPFG